jgi:nucleoside-diphosphate-sugar epimerase
MRVVVIGGTGHIGTYLVPRLIREGLDVTVVTRRRQAPYRSDLAWARASFLEIDRTAAEAAGTFAPRIAALEADVVIDLISFTPESTAALVEVLRGRVQHFLHCGTIWVKGYMVEAPTREDTPSPPIGEYGIAKRAIEELLHREARRGAFPATLVHPGHLVGPGYNVVNPVGNHNPEIFSRLARGERLPVPNFGMELLNHVHADDVAQVFVRALENWSAAVGESFFAVAPAAVTVRGYAERAASWFGRAADLEFMPWEEWADRSGLPASDVESSRMHLSHGQCCSIEKAVTRLGYRPRYTAFDAIEEAVDWLVAHGRVQTA